jgi:hypothetical protein
MAKSADDMLLEQAFKKPLQQKASAKEEVKCEDFSNILRRWMAQIKGPKSVIEKIQPTVNPRPAPMPSTDAPKPSGMAVNAATFWEKLKLGNKGNPVRVLVISGREVQHLQETL